MNSPRHTSHMQAGAPRVTAHAHIDALRNVSPETKAAVLGYAHVKIFLKLAGAAG